MVGLQTVSSSCNEYHSDLGGRPLVVRRANASVCWSFLAEVPLCSLFCQLLLLNLNPSGRFHLRGLRLFEASAWCLWPSLEMFLSGKADGWKWGFPL
jgi:hypothetical protein